MSFDRSSLDVFPRKGWVAAPVPVTPLEELASELGLGWLGLKRDDHIAELHGGSKIRKLDFLLAADPWEKAEAWASMGAIGSGQLVASAAAAAHLGKGFQAHIFWEETSPKVLENLAFTAANATELVFSGSRITTALWRPALVLGGSIGNAVVIPPGATHPIGTLGIIRGGLELAEQVRAGELPEPDELFVPIGSCGTAAGLAIGLALGRLNTRVRAIAVESPFASQGRVNRLIASTIDVLGTKLELPRDFQPAQVVLDKAFIGRGYGYPSPAGLAAIEKLRPLNLPLEAVYSAKAMAGLLARSAELKGSNVVFWLTPRGSALPSEADWKSRLPPALQARLSSEGRISRRRVLVGGAAVAAAVIIGVRTTGYPSIPPGEVLSSWELHVLAAAAEALLPKGPGPSPLEVARNVDRYLIGMPTPILRDIHGLLGLLEQGTGLGCQPRRFTKIDVASRLTFLDRLRRYPDPIRSAYRGIRDLTLLGHYQDPRTWDALGYNGPLVSTSGIDGRPPQPPSRYDVYRAKPGAQPKGVVS